MEINKNVIYSGVVISLVGFYGSFLLVKRVIFARQSRLLKNMRDRRKLEKAENLSKFENSFNIGLNDAENVTNLPFVELLKLLESDKNNEIVIKSFQRKAFDVHQQVNCVVEFLDVKQFSPNLNGPLAGLPVSLKDNFCVEGYLSCAGCSFLLDKPSTKHSVLVNVLLDLGAVPFVKTSVPQTMMSILSYNPIDGTVLNPLNLNKSPGGSSSGEAALVASKGSIAGFGTDIGGSVRIPASFCGIVGFKPTCGRLSKKDMLKLGNAHIVSGSCGILAREVSAVSFIFESIVNSVLHHELDRTVVPLKFDKYSYESEERLKIGYFVYDGSFEVVPAVKRSVLETVELLKTLGHEVVRWNPPVKGECWIELYLSALVCDKGNDLHRILYGDELETSVSRMLKMINLSRLRHFIMYSRATITKDTDLLIWLRACKGERTASQMLDLVDKIKNLRTKILDDWNKKKIDLIVCPVTGFTTLPLQTPGSTTGMLSYANLWNLVDLPAGNVPVSRVTKFDIQEMIEKYPKDKSTWHRNTFKAQKDSVGMPVSVQCVAKPWREEVCLRIMREIQENTNASLTDID